MLESKLNLEQQQGGVYYDITLNNISKTYNSKSSAPFDVLKNINLDIDKGLNVIVGKSGCGKSTLLNLIGGIDYPTNGIIQYDGLSLGSSEKDICEFRNKRMGFIFQSFYLEPALTIMDNVTLPLIISNVDTIERKRERKNCYQSLDC